MTTLTVLHSSSLVSLPRSQQAQAIATLSNDQAASALYDWSFWARPAQLAPPGDWLTWFLLAGRGFGKTRTVVEWVRSKMESGLYWRFAIVAATAADARDVLVEGESGFLAVCPPWNMPIYEATKRRLTWPNGARATLYSSERPDRLRGPQHDGAVADELAAWKYDQLTWDNLMLGLRSGPDPQVAVATTPRPTKIIKDLVADETTALTGGTTYENRANLSPKFYDRIVRRYEGTRLGRQELLAQILLDNPNALWNLTQIDKLRIGFPPDMVRVVVAVDPSATGGKNADEAGIITAGLGADGHGYILGDDTIRASPHGWGSKAVLAYHTHNADRIVAETNNGGEMVELTIRTVDNAVAYKAVHASRGKRTRAEPVAALYEQGRVHHVGTYSKLEDEMTDWVPGDPSPNRMDALVWALHELMLEKPKRKVRLVG